MGQKVCAHGFRVGPTLIKGWDSIFYAEKHYKTLFIQDLRIRELINKNFSQAQVSKILIERHSNKSIIQNIEIIEQHSITRSGNSFLYLVSESARLEQRLTITTDTCFALSELISVVTDLHPKTEMQ